VSAPWFPLMLEETRQLLRELVRAGGTDPDTIAPAKPPYDREPEIAEEVPE